MSFYNLLYHVTFATKRREPTIEISNERRVYALLHSIMKKYGVVTLRIGGMPDHIHIFAGFPAEIAVSDLIKAIKRESSLFIRQNKILTNWNGWQDGYSIFTYSRHDKDKIVNYIKGQKEHHKKVSYIDELREWLIENGVSPDAPYFPK